MIRPATADDLRFVRDAWSRSLRDDGPKPLRQGWGALVTEVATLRTVRVDEAEDGLLDGFLVLEGGSIVHMVYVRQSARRQGVAQRLIGPLRVCQNVRYTYPCHGWLRGKVPPGWTYAPHLLLRGNQHEAEAT